jgi:hypothetical protein
MEVILPNRWEPRHYQRRLWSYLETGGKRAVGVWHRRAGKDEVCLHWAACAAMQRVGNYWHMLPEASQALQDDQVRDSLFALCGGDGQAVTLSRLADLMRTLDRLKGQGS